MIHADQLDKLLLNSSRVEIAAIHEKRTWVRLDTFNPAETFDLSKAQLEVIEETKVQVVPIENTQNRQYLDLTTLKVVLIPVVRSKGMCLWHPNENILFFADQDQLKVAAREFGFCPVFFTAFIVEVGEAEIEMPAIREITIYPEAAFTIPTYVAPWIPGVLGGSPTIRLNV